MASLFFLIFLILLVFSFFNPFEFKGKQFAFLFFCFCFLLLAGLRGEGVDKDYDSYVIMFNVSDFAVEPTFTLISSFVQTFLSSNILYLFLIYAALGVTIKCIAIKQLTELWFLSLIIYCSYFFMLHEMTQIRAGVASAFLLLSIKPIYERNLKLFLIYATLGALFHYSAILIFPLWFLKDKPRKNWLIYSVPVAYLLFLLKVNLIIAIPIPGIQEKIEIYKTLQELGGEESKPINVFNLFILTKIGIFYFMLYKYDVIILNNKYSPILLKIYCLSLIAIPIFANIQTIGFRVSELFGIVEIILIPLIYYAFKQIYFGRALVISIGVTMMLIVTYINKLIVF
jgi:hypothetical protein